MIPNIDRHIQNKYEINKINREKEKNRKKINQEKSQTKFRDKCKKNINIKTQSKTEPETEPDPEPEPEPDTIIPSYYNNSIFNLEINKSTIESAGLGVFALELIPAKKCIGKYEGVKKTHNKTGDYYFEINNKVGIDAINYPRCYMAMINDSYKTENKINCEFRINEIKEMVEIWSIENIDVGSELFISYGNDYWIDI
jgi:hypothetical protein